MIFFPQLSSGAVAQMPLRRIRAWRSILNQLESGEIVTLGDSAAGQITWRLRFDDLSTSESGTISSLFNSVRGRHAPFLFIDPTANLLGWSENLSQPDWQTGLLSISTEAADPTGTTRASVLSNSNPGPQSIAQSLGVPGEYVTCFSAWISSAAGAQVTLGRDESTRSVNAGPVWQRVFVSGSGVPGATSSTFSLTVGASSTVNVWGLQVEAQPYASIYKPTRAALGIYEETYFAMDQILMTATGPGLSSVEIELESRQ